MTYKTRAVIGNLIGGLLALVAASSASAQSGPTIRVHYKASELQSQDGAKAVYERIKSAARRACSYERWGVVDRACRNELVGLAVEKLGNPTVTALYSGRSSTQIATR